MLEIAYGDDGEIVLSGRFDASQQEKAESFLDGVSEARVVDMGGLDYISSAGLGSLLKTQKRLIGSGGGLKLVNVSKHIHDVFRYSGFDQIFEIDPPKD